jgi:hypothetical protein
MGVYTDLIAGAKSWDSGADGITVATDRVITKDIKRFQAKQGDVPHPSGYAEADEVQVIAAMESVVSGGNYTITINIDGTAHTTANIAHDAVQAAIETAIDVVATGNVTSWTNGDISVALTGNMAANAATLTYDGASVDATNHPSASCDDVDLTGNSTGTVAETAAGAAGTDEIQELASHVATVSGGTFTITINLADEAAFTTANIAYDAVAATIESAIDTAATTAAVVSWVNGDINVALTANLVSNPATFTYNGASVDSTDQGELTVDGALLTGGGTEGAISTTTPGVAGTDEVQTIAIFPAPVASGNYTLTINVTTDAAFDTANIAYDANAATIQTAVDTAATGNITAWENGAITVTGGPLTTAPVVLTFDGVSVDNADQVTTIVNDIDLDPDYSGATTVTTNGQTVRLALSALNVMGVIDSPPPAQGTTSGLVATTTRASNPWMPRQETLQALAMQAAIDDGTDGMYGALMATMGLSHLL